MGVPSFWGSMAFGPGLSFLRPFEEGDTDRLRASFKGAPFGNQGMWDVSVSRQKRTMLVWAMWGLQGIVPGFVLS